jgi:hypothetical protein
MDTKLSYINKRILVCIKSIQKWWNHSFILNDKFFKVWRPDSRIRNVWDTFQVILICIIMFYTSVALTFPVNLVNSIAYNTLRITGIVSFFIHILVNFNTGFFSQGIMVILFFKSVYFFFI